MIGKSENKLMRRLMLPVYGMLVAMMMTFMPPAASAASKGTPNADAMLAPIETPPGIGTKVTYFGAVFTDKRGMTLYQHTSDWPCMKKRRSLRDDAPALLSVYANYAAPFCIDQWPALMASENDKPVGDWTIVDRPNNEGQQWAYKGYPMHLSNRDLLPGDVNGPTKDDYIESQSLTNTGFVVAYAPMILPPGVKAMYARPYGLVATTERGLLYIFDGPSAEKGGLKNVSLSCSDCSTDSRWKPFPAGALATNMGPWQVVRLNDGSKAWAFEGKVVHTYIVDQEARNSKGLGVREDVSLVTMNPMPMAPRGFTVQTTLLGPTYADARGMTTYNFYCAVAQPGEARRSEVAPNYWCDGVDADMAFREMFCAAPDKCGDRWRPVEAPPEAEPQGGLWSVAVIPDKRYSLRWVHAKPGEKLAPGAIKVWTYRGRPVFTSAFDQKPTEMWGHEVQLDQNPLWHVVRAGEPEERGIAAGN